jgi:hypothetical protein
MPPSRSVRSDSDGKLDEVDEYIRRRRDERGQMRDLLDTEFFWSELPTANAAAPSPEALTRAWDDAVDARETDPPRALPAGQGARTTGQDPAGRRSPGQGPRHRASGHRHDPSETRQPASAERHLRAVPALADAAAWQAGPGEAPERRTVVITGRGAERYVAPRRSAGTLMRHERAGFKPDRVAMWAVLLGIALLLGAATSSHAATLHAALHAHI